MWINSEESDWVAVMEWVKMQKEVNEESKS